MKVFPYLFLILLISGCSSPKSTVIADALDATPVVSGTVVSHSALSQGGALALGPFRPGTGAPANDDTDLLSLMISKGIGDTLALGPTAFTVQKGAVKSPQYVLEGTLEDYGRKSRLLGLKNKVHLSVDGNIWMAGTGQKVLLFQTSILIDLKTQNPKTAAYQMGVAIAHFIESRE